MRIEFCRLATLYFAAWQDGHKRGNKRNNVLQLAMQQCCESSLTTLDLINNMELEKPHRQRQRQQERRYRLSLHTSQVAH